MSIKQSFNNTITNAGIEINKKKLQTFFFHSSIEINDMDIFFDLQTQKNNRKVGELTTHAHRNTHEIRLPVGFDFDFVSMDVTAGVLPRRSVALPVPLP